MHGSNEQLAEQTSTPPRRFSLARLAKQPLVIRTPQGCVVIGAEHRDGKRRVTVSVESAGEGSGPQINADERGSDLRSSASSAAAASPLGASRSPLAPNLSPLSEDPLDICSPERLRSS